MTIKQAEAELIQGLETAKLFSRCGISNNISISIKAAKVILMALEEWENNAGKNGAKPAG